MHNSVVRGANIRVWGDPKNQSNDEMGAASNSIPQHLRSITFDCLSPAAYGVGLRRSPASTTGRTCAETARVLLVAIVASADMPDTRPNGGPGTRRRSRPTRRDGGRVLAERKRGEVGISGRRLLFQC